MIAGFKTFGLLFGYPQCCIESFSYHVENGRSPAQMAGEGPWGTTGFIPCLEHAVEMREIGLDEFVAKYITPNRLHKLPFPRDDMPGDFIKSVWEGRQRP
jgi:hypothetical protein